MIQTWQCLQKMFLMIYWIKYEIQHLTSIYIFPPYWNFNSEFFFPIWETMRVSNSFMSNAEFGQHVADKNMNPLTSLDSDMVWFVALMKIGTRRDPFSKHRWKTTVSRKSDVLSAVATDPLVMVVILSTIFYGRKAEARPPRILVN